MLSINFAGAYTQDFNSLPNTGMSSPWSNDVTLPGWHLFRQPAPGTAITTLGINHGNSNAGSFYSYGLIPPSSQLDSIIEVGEDRALGSLGSGGSYFAGTAVGATTGWMALALDNATGHFIDAIEINYDGEQWRNGGNTTSQTLSFEYGFGNSFETVGTWTAAGESFNFTSPVHTSTATELVGDLAQNRVAGIGGPLLNVNWDPGERLWVRWSDKNDAEADHGLSIDNVSVRSISPLFVTNLDNLGPGTLRNQIAAAAAIAGPNIIYFAPDLAGGTIFLDHSELNIDDPDPLEIVGPGANLLTLDGRNEVRLFSIESLSGTGDVHISGLSLANGRADGTNGESRLGGAIRNREKLTITDVTFDNNFALNFGGAIDSLGGHLVITDSRFINNTASIAHGGAISSSSPTSISSTTFSNNHAGLGGGAINSTESLILNESLVAWNIAGESGGGLLASTAAGSVLVRNSTFSGNTANDSGGGVFLQGAGPKIFRHSTFTNNTADADNTGPGSGGGIYVGSGALELDHTIVARNTDLSLRAADIDDAHGMTSATYSFIGTKAGSLLVPTSGGSDANGNRIGGAASTSMHYVQFDVAAMGSFEPQDDFYQFQYSVDGGPPQPLLTFGPALIPVAQQYVMANGQIVPLFIPLGVNEAFPPLSPPLLRNTFQTIGAFVPAATESLQIIFTGSSFSETGDDAFAFRNVRVLQSFGSSVELGAALTGGADHHVNWNYSEEIESQMLQFAMFGIRDRSMPLPEEIKDDSVSNSSDQQGIIREDDFDEFFGVVGTVNAGSGGSLSARLTFDVSVADGPIHPQLGPLANNGGRTLTHAPAFGSPVINSGQQGLMGGSGGVPLYDQRGLGFARVSGERIDIGAFEVQASTPPSGDFDADGDVDGRDFLRWQRGQSPSPLSSGDLAAWQDNYGDQGLEIGAHGAEDGGLVEAIAMSELLIAVGRGEYNSDRSNRGDTEVVVYEDRYVEEVDLAMEQWSGWRAQLGKTTVAPFGEMVARRGVKQDARNI